MAGRTGFVARKLMALATDSRGATAIEYGLIIGIIAAALILGMESIRDNLLAIFKVISDTLANSLA